MLKCKVLECEVYEYKVLKYKVLGCEVLEYKVLKYRVLEYKVLEYIVLKYKVLECATKKLQKVILKASCDVCFKLYPRRSKNK